MHTNSMLDCSDPLTGRSVRRWTTGPAKDQHLYFTSPTVTSDGRWLAIISERSGSPNLGVIDRSDGSYRQVSDNREGLLRGYVYPRGGLRGLAKGSPALHAASGRLVWIQDDALWTGWAGRSDPAQRVCALPAGWWSGFSDISRCGRYACVCVADPQAFGESAGTQGEQMRHVLGHFRDQALRSRVILVDCATGTVEADVAVPFWVTHLNLHPEDPRRVVINMEGGNVGQRIWRLDLGRARLEPLFPQLGDEWTCHECWDPQGRSIVYHGGRRGGGQAYVERRSYDGDLISRRSAEGVQFAHATLSADGGSYLIDCQDGLIRRWGIDGGDLEVLCRHDSDYADQDAHPHPRSAPDGRSLIFTSSREGACNVYEVGL
jgi:oligogalacturonide lyase